MGDEYEPISLYMCRKFPKMYFFNGALRLGKQSEIQRPRSAKDKSSRQLRRGYETL